jgi:hypothetical protein
LDEEHPAASTASAATAAAVRRVALYIRRLS